MANRTCRPRPFPSEAPSMMPGKSSSCIRQSLWWITPGIHVSVVNSYEAVSDFVVVKVDKMVDLPTDGKPMSATRASPTCER
jgi:hypothetical protein